MQERTKKKLLLKYNSERPLLQILISTFDMKQNAPCLLSSLSHSDEEPTDRNSHLGFAPW